jgi:hypothetical protein
MFGEALKARKYRLQVKEIKIKVILYNLSRMISTFAFLILFKEFYRAQKRTSYKKSITIYNSIRFHIGIETIETFIFHNLKYIMEKNLHIIEKNLSVCCIYHIFSI